VIASRLDFAVAAEAAGIGHYHVTEHHGTPLSVCPAPNLFLAALSQRTTRLRIGALVYVLPAHEPLRLAEEIAVLDQLSHGRLDVGVGSGVSPYELAYFGVDAGQARARYAETLDVVTRALATGRMTHTGTLLRDYDAAAQASMDRFRKANDVFARQLTKINYFEATLAFGDLTAAEAQANLAAFAETVMPGVRQAGQCLT
jgi:alkanesulfonate monooxygenase SsuD/methylene tetrahydromethanopterin reductase-like flavin-dependent oxidoreductase (luciferase family)